MNLMLWTGDDEGPGHYRMIYPAEALTERGHNCYVSPKYMTDVDIDVVVGQRVSNEGATVYWQEHLKHLPRVFEIDDDLWNVHHTSASFPHYRQQGVKDRLAANAQAADAVTVTTPYLAEVLSQYNDNVHVLPNYLPESLFTLTPHEHQSESVTIGWSGGSTHQVDAPIVKYPLKQVLKRHANVSFHVTGWNMGAYLKLPHTYTHWTGDLHEHYKRLDFDIGICPLAPNRFNRAKSPLKALEFAGRGIPVIASDDSPYELYADQDWLILCRTEQDWLRELTDLVNDADRRKELGLKAYKWAQTQTYSKHIDEWETLYVGLRS